MVFVDTSVWVAHLREGKIGLEGPLMDGRVVCHPFVIGELACGTIKNRSEVLSLLNALPMAAHAEHDEAMRFIENYRLAGKGLGYVDVHLLASAMLAKIPLWTLDKRLNKVSSILGLEYRKA